MNMQQYPEIVDFRSWQRFSKVLNGKKKNEKKRCFVLRKKSDKSCFIHTVKCQVKDGTIKVEMNEHVYIKEIATDTGVVLSKTC